MTAETFVILFNIILLGFYLCLVGVVVGILVAMWSGDRAIEDYFERADNAQVVKALITSIEEKECDCIGECTIPEHQ